MNGDLYQTLTENDYALYMELTDEDREAPLTEFEKGVLSCVEGILDFLEEGR